MGQGGASAHSKLPRYRGGEPADSHKQGSIQRAAFLKNKIFVHHMKKLLIFIMLLACAFGAQAQTSMQQDDSKITQMRKDIGIDYSMPDFKTKKIDGSIIGTHLAGMLNLLQKYYNDGTYNWKLAAIVKEQKGMVSQVSVDKLKINEVRKVGDKICVMMKIKLAKNIDEIKSADIIITFDKGISESDYVNSLFSYLSRYVQN